MLTIDPTVILQPSTNTNNKILNGHYKDTYLSCKTNWKSRDHCPKLLGIYENQVQEKIIQEKKKL